MTGLEQVITLVGVLGLISGIVGYAYYITK